MSGIWARVCLGLAEVRVCLGLAELGGACSRVPGALVLGYGGPCGVCSQVSGACVCLGMVELVGCVVGYQSRVCFGMAETGERV